MHPDRGVPQLDEEAKSLTEPEVSTHRQALPTTMSLGPAGRVWGTLA